MHRGSWWERPRLHTAEDGEERKVSWLELFHDLVFVVVIAELAHYLSGHISSEGVLGYVLLFGPVWWVWMGGTYYNSRFETGDISYRLLTFLQMLPVAALAIFAHDGLGALSGPFALTYAAARALIIAMWVRGGWHNPPLRPITNRYALGFGLSMLLFVASVFVAPPLRFGLWGLGLLCDFIAPITTLRLQAHAHLSNVKLPERFGLLVLIVLGEAIVGVVSGVADQHEFSLLTALTGVVGMALVFGVWWIYFDFISRHAAFRRPRASIWWGLVWGYTHLPLVMSIAALSAGVLHLLTDHSGPEVRWLICGALALMLLATALIECSLHRDPDEPTNLPVSAGLKLAGAALALLTGLLELSAPALLGLLLAPLVLQMVYGAYVWFRPAQPPALVARAAEE
jgi:low temperature requirement protein LtrA